MGGQQSSRRDPSAPAEVVDDAVRLRESFRRASHSLIDRRVVHFGPLGTRLRHERRFVKRKCILLEVDDELQRSSQADAKSVGVLVWAAPHPSCEYAGHFVLNTSETPVLVAYPSRLRRNSVVWTPRGDPETPRARDWISDMIRDPKALSHNNTDIAEDEDVALGVGPRGTAFKLIAQDGQSVTFRTGSMRTRDVWVRGVSLLSSIRPNIGIAPFVGMGVSMWDGRHERWYHDGAVSERKHVERSDDNIKISYNRDRWETWVLARDLPDDTDVFLHGPRWRRYGHPFIGRTLRFKNKVVVTVREWTVARPEAYFQLHITRPRVDTITTTGDLKIRPNSPHDSKQSPTRFSSASIRTMQIGEKQLMQALVEDERLRAIETLQSAIQVRLSRANANQKYDHIEFVQMHILACLSQARTARIALRNKRWRAARVVLASFAAYIATRQKRVVFQSILAMQALVRTHEQKRLYRDLIKRFSKVRNLEREFLDKEQKYVNNLTLLKTVFLEPMKKAFGQKHFDHVDKIRSALDRILLFHRDTIFPELQALHKAQITSDNPHSIPFFDAGAGTVMLKYAQYFKVYTDYLCNYTHCEDEIKRLNSKSSFQRFLKAQRASAPEGERYGDMRSYLIMPVQKIPHYKLLLQDIVKRFPESLNPVYVTQTLKPALAQVKKTAAHNNAMMKSFETAKRLEELQTQITGDNRPDIVAPSRVFMEEGLFDVSVEYVTGLLRVYTKRDASTMTTLPITSKDTTQNILKCIRDKTSRKRSVRSATDGDPTRAETNPDSLLLIIRAHAMNNSNSGHDETPSTPRSGKRGKRSPQKVSGGSRDRNGRFWTHQKTVQLLPTQFPMHELNALVSETVGPRVGSDGLKVEVKVVAASSVTVASDKEAGASSDEKKSHNGETAETSPLDATGTSTAKRATLHAGMPQTKIKCRCFLFSDMILWTKELESTQQQKSSMPFLGSVDLTSVQSPVLKGATIHLKAASNAVIMGAASVPALLGATLRGTGNILIRLEQKSEKKAGEWFEKILNACQQLQEKAEHREKVAKARRLSQTRGNAPNPPDSLQDANVVV